MLDSFGQRPSDGLISIHGFFVFARHSSGMSIDEDGSGPTERRCKGVNAKTIGQIDHFNAYAGTPRLTYWQANCLPDCTVAVGLGPDELWNIGARGRRQDQA